LVDICLDAGVSLFDSADVYSDGASERILGEAVLWRPTVSSVLIGARNADQLRQNLGAVEWKLSVDQVARLGKASAIITPYPHYPYWNGQFSELSPAPV
jgi:aryl-alcohol dehydrogenase-like predicted oxidoreductase